MKDKLNVGMIGYRFMGKAHSHAYRDINMFFKLKHQMVLHTLCGTSDEVEQAAENYGYLHAVHNWKEVVDNPEIDIIDICTPDNLHKEIAVYAAKAGKNIMCEKPLCLNYQDAEEMYRAVKESGVTHMCNFTYRGVPAVKLAKQIIDEGKIGTIYQCNAYYLQDFSLSKEYPFVWRMDKEISGAGIIGDKGAHIIDLARYLTGEISEVSALPKTYITSRRVPGTDKEALVTTCDAASFLVNFHNGAMGVFQVSNMSAGRKNALILEIYGSKGALKFDLERINELEVYYDGEEPQTRGFKKVQVTESCHNYISNWWPSGHVLGWEHTFIHQIYDFICAIEEMRPAPSNFYDGMRCQQVVDAVAMSARTHRWVTVEEIGGKEYGKTTF